MTIWLMSRNITCMQEYIVLSRRIATGTISDHPPASRFAWIIVLFEAERLRGRVHLPVRDLAKMASITTAEAAEALRMFQEPDELSASKDHEGRRLVPIEGEPDWYTVVTWEGHAKARKTFFDRLRKQRQREKVETAKATQDRKTDAHIRQKPEAKLI